jgi:RNA polymerase sigma-70 factor (ECF subfamily)
MDSSHHSREAAVGSTRGGELRALPFEGDDAALVDGVRAGRVDALAALYDRHVDAVHGVVFRVLGPDRDHDDVVQDVFVRALESLPRLRDPSVLRSWLVGIAVMTIRIHLQRRRRQRWLRFLPSHELPEPAAPSDDAASDELKEVWRILAELPPDERIALVLCRVEGLALDDAAAACAMSVATLRRRLARGEAKFLARAARRPGLSRWLEGTR